MLRCLLVLSLIVVGCCSLAEAKGVIDPEVAAEDFDFAIQGEYVGEGRWPQGDKVKIGAQVIALSDNKFDTVLYRGGLPGDGWQRGDDRLRLSGETSDGKTTLQGDGHSAEIVEGTMNVSHDEGETSFELKKTQRQSPTLGLKPPNDATVLFAGESTNAFKDGQLSELGTLEAGCTTKENHPIERLHIEFRLSYRPDARGQGRSNSGVYIGGLPEIQVLDSFGLEGKRNECGALYGRREPDVNMCFPPLVWQTFDVEFHEPEDGENQVRATIRHNGVVVHENVSAGRDFNMDRRLHLQKHGNRVQYRNIWLTKPEE